MPKKYIGIAGNPDGGWPYYMEYNPTVFSPYPTDMYDKKYYGLEGNKPIAVSPVTVSAKAPSIKPLQNARELERYKNKKQTTDYYGNTIEPEWYNKERRDVTKWVDADLPQEIQDKNFKADASINPASKPDPNLDFMDYATMAAVGIPLGIFTGGALADLGAATYGAVTASPTAMAYANGLGKTLETAGGLYSTGKVLRGEYGRDWKEDLGTALGFTPLGYNALYTAGKAYDLGKDAIATSTNPNMQYVRYGLGKVNGWMHGYNPHLPQMYRKVNQMPVTTDGKIVLTPPENRFAFNNGNGVESPVITNMTSDIQVRKHGSDSWDKYLTLSFPGKTLLGKNVISTRPSDTFTYGDILSVPKRDVTAFSGNLDEVKGLENLGIKTITTPELQRAYNESVLDYNLKHNIGDPYAYLAYSPYSKETQKIIRNTFKNPTVQDYDFMDYVFNPKYKSEVIPRVPITEETIKQYPILGEWYGSESIRRNLSDDSWGNVYYHPASPVEDMFRKTLGIDCLRRPKFSQLHRTKSVTHEFANLISRQS